jgi:hypothetical protein
VKKRLESKNNLKVFKDDDKQQTPICQPNPQAVS